MLDDLITSVGATSVVTDPDRMESYRHDHTFWLEAGTPLAVVLPTTTEHVAATVRTAATHGVPIVARGAGSSLAGGATAIDNGLIVSLERMNQIVHIDVDNQLAVVQPGVINSHLSQQAAPLGLFYPPDPASRDFSTIGGNIATNAGGLCCVKYGVTRDHVMGLEVVLADGQVIRTGGRTIKGVAGLDLTSLFVGSEGTLGIITEATVRLRPKPSGGATVVAFFDTLEDAGSAVELLRRSGPRLSLMELMDRTAVDIADEYGRFGMDRSAAALLLLQADDPPPVDGDYAQRAASLCEAAGATFTAHSSDPDEAEALLQARRVVGTAADALPGVAIHEDVAVPPSALTQLIAQIEGLAAAHQIRIATVGHVGDGNLHPILLIDDTPEAFAEAMEVFDQVVEAAQDLGGTATGEHGVGSIKAKHLARELGSDHVAMQRAIKHALDPHRVFAAGTWL